MNLEEKLAYLGAKTQSEESIRLCYIMDLEAFSMMEAVSTYRFLDERDNYELVFKSLLDELGYEKMNEAEKEEADEALMYLDLDEEDKDYRDKFFTGLERTLLRFNHFELISFQPFNETTYEGKAQDAYLYELNKLYDEAIRLYKDLGFNDRLGIVENKKLLEEA